MAGNSVAALPRHPSERRRRLSAAEKVARDQQIVIDRHKGLSWLVIAQRHGLSERQARNVYRAWVETEREPLAGLDPLEWLRETLERWESIINSLAEIAQSADNDAARVGALRSQMTAMHHQTALYVAAGILPRNIAEPFYQVEAREGMRRVIGVLERHEEIGPDVLNEMADVLDEIVAGGAVALTQS